MLQNYLKIAWRNILKRKLTAVITISSLAIGLAVCFVIGLYVLHETSYDKFIPESDRIVRVVLEAEDGYRAAAPPGLANALETGVSGIEALTEVSRPRSLLMTVDNSSIEIGNTIWTDSFFTEIFPVEEITGNAQQAFTEPGKIVLTRTTALRLFGEINVTGSVIQVEYSPGRIFNHEVAAVVKDPPSNLHFKFNALLSLTSQYQRMERYGSDVKWDFWGGYVYIKVDENTDFDSFQERMSRLEANMKKPEWWSDDLILTTQPLTDIHLADNVSSDIAAGGDWQYLLIFTAIGLLILGMACFNYMNLTTARTLPRAEEVGMRKVVGATRGGLVLQFMTEAVVTALIAFPVALLLTEFSLPYVYEFLDKEFVYGLFEYPSLMVIAGVIVIISGMLSGIYPALMISSYHPADIFRKWKTTGSNSSGFQKSLVVIQFTIAILFIVSALVIQRQLNFVQQKKLGFDEERVVLFNVVGLQDRYDTFKEEALSHASILSMTSGATPGMGYKNMVTNTGRRSDSLFADTPLTGINVDYDYVETIGLKLLKGRGFSRAYSLDKESSVVLSEKGAAWFGLGDHPIGKTVEVAGKTREIIGIVEDYHNESLKKEIQPVALLLTPGNRYTAMARLAPGNIEQGLNDIRKSWKNFLGNRPIDITFLDERIQVQYREQQRQARLMSVFSGIAIFVACFGLLGLVFLMTVNRTKEIGIRKVLGASVSNITGLLSKDFIKLVLLGFLIAVPIAWYAMNRWLADFAYRIEIGPGIFLLAGGVAIAIALLTVSWQSIRAALANPVESLRSE